MLVLLENALISLEFIILHKKFISNLEKSAKKHVELKKN